MLVLKRKPEESIIIDVGEERIVVKILTIDNPYSVRVGVEASLHVKILRDELLERDRSERK